MIYLKKSPTNIGPFQVRVDPDSDEATAYYVEITTDPQPFTPGIGEGLLSVYTKQLVEVQIEDVPTEFLHPDDSPRVACEVDGCGKDYANQANLDKHIKASHGNILEQLLTAEPAS